MRFRAVEFDLVRLLPVLQEDVLPGWGALPWGALTQAAQLLEATDQLHYSDLGYVDESHMPWPPYVAQSLDLSRSLTLTADALGGSFSIGNLELNNPSGVLDRVFLQDTIDHLPMRILQGQKTQDLTRGVFSDPPRSALVPLFSGYGRNWQPGYENASVALLDQTEALTQEMPMGTFGGTGGLDGDSSVAGRLRPRLRGSACNITPILIDSTNYVYQVSDAPADILSLYEGGYTGWITSAGEVTDLYASAPDPGTYVIQRMASGTWIRLGTKPVYAITLDVFGHFPSGAAPTGLGAILQQMLLEDCAQTALTFDTGWDTPSLACAGGWFWDGSSSVTGKSVVSTLLSGLAVSLVSTRNGALRLVPLVPPTSSQAPALHLTPDLVTEISSIALDTTLDPPTWRWRIGWQHNFTVQSSGSALHPRISSAREALVTQANRQASWVDMSVKSSWRTPSDPDVVVTALANEADATTLATLHGALWGRQRKLWAVTLPQEIALQIELGDAVTFLAPVPGARVQAVPAIVIGEHLQSGETTTTLTLLV